MGSLFGDFFRDILTLARHVPDLFLRWRWTAAKIVSHQIVWHWDGVTQFCVGEERMRHCVEFGGLYVFNRTSLTLSIVALDLRFSVNSREFGRDSRQLPMPVPLPACDRGGLQYEVEIPPQLVVELRNQRSDCQFLQIGGAVIIKTIHGLQRLDVHKNIAAIVSRN